MNVRVVDVPADQPGSHRISPSYFCGACLNFSRELKGFGYSFPSSTVKSNFVLLSFLTCLKKNLNASRPSELLLFLTFTVLVANPKKNTPFFD